SIWRPGIEGQHRPVCDPGHTFAHFGGGRRRRERLLRADLIGLPMSHGPADKTSGLHKFLYSVSACNITAAAQAAAKPANERGRSAANRKRLGQQGQNLAVKPLQSLVLLRRKP